MSIALRYTQMKNPSLRWRKEGKTKKHADGTLNGPDSNLLPIQLFRDSHYSMRIADQDPLAARLHQPLPLPL